MEKANGGIGMPMIGGSSIVAPDSAAAFGNIQLYRDEAVGCPRGSRTTCTSTALMIKGHPSGPAHDLDIRRVVANTPARPSGWHVVCRLRSSRNGRAVAC